MKSMLNILILVILFTSYLFAQKPCFQFVSRSTADNLSQLSEYELLQYQYEECTIGVAAGSATADGRPLLWKTRDTINFDNEIVYVTSNTNKYIMVINAGQLQYAWMGVNEHGFAILNSIAYDLMDHSPRNDAGELMRYALGNCTNVADFESLLVETNTQGRWTTVNFGVIDATGAAAIYEASGSEFWKFDANDTLQAPDGYILRTNFTVNGGGNIGIERYNRTQKLISDFYSGDTLCYKSILRTQMRDFSDENSDPVPVPYLSQWNSNVPVGYIYTEWGICRGSSASAAVIHGVHPYESPLLSTMWTILGQPAATIAVPYWPVGSTPSAADGSSTAPLCNVANDICDKIFHYISNIWYLDTHKLRDPYGGGIWTSYFSAEDSIFSATDSLMSIWRSDTLNVEQMLSEENKFAEFALQVTTDCNELLATAIQSEDITIVPFQFLLDQNYPNPFNPSTTIEFTLPKSEFVELKVFNILGKEVSTLVSNKLNQGNHTYQFDGKNLASGIYYYQLVAGDPSTSSGQRYREVKKMILLR